MMPLATAVLGDWIQVGILLAMVITWLVGAVAFLWIRGIDQRASRAELLEAELKRSNSEAIATEMKLIRAELQIPISELNTMVASIRERMNDGSEHFDMVDEKSHRLELKTQQMVGDLKTEMVASLAGLATKSDVDAIATRLTQCQAQRKCN